MVLRESSIHKHATVSPVLALGKYRRRPLLQSSRSVPSVLPYVAGCEWLLVEVGTRPGRVISLPEVRGKRQKSPQLPLDHYVMAHVIATVQWGSVSSVELVISLTLWLLSTP